MNKLITLEIDMAYGDTVDKIHPVVLCDETNCVLVDCGYIGALTKLEEALRSHEILPEDITHIIITHQDHDHVGALASFKKKYSKVKILASAEEAPFISGTRKSLRLEQAEQLQKELPPQMQEFGRRFCELLRSVEPVPIDQVLYGGEQLPFCGGCQVISSPGHTPGHISLYIPEFDTIIAGDAIALEDGKPVIANPQFTLDMETANASLENLLAHSAKHIICYHGGLLEKPCGCLAKGTYVLMKDKSLKQIQDIMIGDRVLNDHSCSLAVINIYDGREYVICCIRFVNGIMLKATMDHPVLTEDGFKPVKDLKIGDHVKCFDGSLLEVQDIYMMEYDDMVYNLLLDGESHVMICENIIVGDLAAEQQHH